MLHHDSASAMAVPVCSSGTSQKPLVLFLSPVEPRADGNGVEKRAWSHLQALSQKARVHLVIAMLLAQDYKHISWDGLRAVCERADFLSLYPSAKMEPSDNPMRKMLRKLEGITTPPFMIDEATLQSLAEASRGARYDRVFCFRMRSFRVWEQLQKPCGFSAGRLYVDFDDIESLATAREIPHLRAVVGRLQTLFAWVDALELWLLERRILKVADDISICSSVDRERLAQRGGRAIVHVIPNSYPLMEQLPRRPMGDVAQILFLGTMAYPPNEDAILYFYRHVFPLICQHYDKPVCLNVVGLRPGPKVLALAEDPAVNVTGGVESVMPYYDAADIVVAPIRFGGGTRIKILEALSYGRPVVSTSIGAEGLDLTPGQDVLIADSPEAFAQSCVTLLRDQELCARLVDNGRERIRQRYERTKVQDTFLATIFGD